MTSQNQIIRAAFATMRRDGPRRHRDIAKILSISEAELLAAHCGGAASNESVVLDVWHLKTQWSDQLAQLKAFGPLMALTRNATCVHEKIGLYQPVSKTGDIGIILGESIDLRIFYTHWALGFAVIEKTAKGLQYSLQYFDQFGIAVHKIFLREESDIHAFIQFKNNFAETDQTRQISISSKTLVQKEIADSDIDVAGFQKEWSAMRDTHDFFSLLKKYKVSREQGFRLAGAGMTQSVRTAECRRILSLVADKRIPVMIFVSNPGTIQIHTGCVQNISLANGWLNILDHDFNLHLRQDQLSSAWVVRKPTVDGVVTSLELFDHAGELVLMLFGQRKPGLPENIQWRACLDQLFIESRLCAV